MLNTQDFFEIVCNNCNEESVDGNGYSWFGDSQFVHELAAENGYIENDDMHYCPECCKKLGIEEEE
jgi:hypothetical protein